MTEREQLLEELRPLAFSVITEPGWQKRFCRRQPQTLSHCVYARCAAAAAYACPTVGMIWPISIALLEGIS